MKSKVKNDFPRNWGGLFIIAVVLSGLLANSAHAFVEPPGYTSGPYYTNLDSWWFNDDTNWTSNPGYPPLAFTNIWSSDLGDGYALVVDDPGNPAFLQFPITNTNGTTNLTVDVGSVIFWYAPNWSSTNQGGNGPQLYSRLLEAGGFTPDSSFGLWSLYVDPVGQNIYFSAQTNDLSSNFCTYVTAPISWTTNYWHFVAFTYSATNTALYLDGLLATNGPPITNYPGANALANGCFIGSDSNGFYQAEGMIDDLYTYRVPLDANTIHSIFFQDDFYFEINPFDTDEIRQAPSSPSYTAPTYDVITGNGGLMLTNFTGVCTYSNVVWITNVTAFALSNGTMNIKFSIEGGEDGVPYDVFANSVMGFGTNTPWAWMGQGYHCNSYVLTGISNAACFLILGTPQDSTGYGLTDAYEQLVLQINPSGLQTDSYGVPYAWYAENGLIPITAGLATQDPDHDALLNYQEYFYGSNPNVAEGSAIWVGTPNGTTAIP